MIANHNLTSLLIPSQLPEHIRDDPSYANFVLFIQAYYEWMEQNGNVTERAKNLLNYKDIDSSSVEFLNYFYNDFLSYFPEEILADKVEVVKLAKKLYNSKGTPASYQLLFRILYNMDVDFFYTKDAVLKASDGKWYVAKSLKLSTDLIYISDISYSNNIITVSTIVPNDLSLGDSLTLSGAIAETNNPNGTWIVSAIIDHYTFSFEVTNIPTGIIDPTEVSVYIPKGFANKHFLSTNNLRIFGETTKSIATIENSAIAGKRVEVFISNIERLFESGEYVRVVDSNNQDVLFDGYPLRAKLLGQISQVNINPTNRGLLYQPNDPVIIYGGLNTPTGIGATAEVKETTKGSIQRIKVESGGYGYTKFISTGLPGIANTRLNISNASGAQAHVTVDDNPVNPKRADVSFIPIDFIGKKAHIDIGNTAYYFENELTANANTSLADTFSFTAFSTYPISSVIVDNGGGGISVMPVITAESLYAVEDSTANNATNTASFANLKSLGILAPIQIIDGGHGYVNNDSIIITGGTGYGAYANVTSVSASGEILSISFVQTSNNITLGGMGYTVGEIIPSPNVANTEVLSTIRLLDNYKLGSGLPSIGVNSANVAAANAVLVIPGILGDGSLFTPSLDRVGSITTISISNYGEDYISVPNVSIKVQDIIVKGLTLDNLPFRGDVVYQGILNSGYVALVDSVEILVPYVVPEETLYRLRVFNYNAKPDYYLPLEIHTENKDISMVLTNQYNSVEPIDLRRDITGVLSYGDGTAKASAKYLNGLTIAEGQYLDTSGHPSSFGVVQSIDYNNYTYKITLEKEIDKYRKTLLDLLHPTGMKVIGRYALKSEAKSDFDIIDSLKMGQPLSYYTNSEASNVHMVASFTNQSNNIVQFDNLNGVELDSFIFENSSIMFADSNGNGIHSEVISINNSANTITLKDNVWLTFANVSYVTANASSNIIHISTLTDSYDIINNGNYSNTAYPLKDIVRTGDVILVANNTIKTVSDVDYSNNIIYLSTNLSNTVNSLMSVNRTLTTTAEFVKIFTPIGQQYNPIFADELGNSLLTEDGSLLILG